MNKNFLTLSIFLLLVGAGCNNKNNQTQQTAANTSPPLQLITTKQKILSEKDFSGTGLLSGNVNKSEDTFTIQINSEVPPYTFHIVSFTPNSVGVIEVFRGEDTEKLLQIINLDPNMRLADSVPLFFNAQDINFDGFLDIGAVVNGGAKWGAYQYWVFDKKTGRFVTDQITDEFKKISFNEITFDNEKKRIITTHLGATESTTTTYQFQDGHWRLLQETR